MDSPTHQHSLHPSRLSSYLPNFLLFVSSRSRALPSGLLLFLSSSPSLTGSHIHPVAQRESIPMVRWFKSGFGILSQYREYHQQNDICNCKLKLLVHDNIMCIIFAYSKLKILVHDNIMCIYMIFCVLCIKYDLDQINNICLRVNFCG